MKIENLHVTGWWHALHGMRNPMQSWDRSDSVFEGYELIRIGPKDLELARKLIRADSSERKFLRFVDVYCDVTANSTFWREWDTYKFTDRNSTSQMHTLGQRLLTREDFDKQTDPRSIDILNENIEQWRKTKSHEDWEYMLNSVPQGYLYTSTIKQNYEVILKQLAMRENHRLGEWREYCKEMKKKLNYYNDLME